MKCFLSLLLLLIIAAPQSWAYNRVGIDKIIPLVDKKAAPSRLKIDNEGHLWILNETNQTLQQISNEGKTELTLAPGKNKESLFKAPVDFAFFSDGSLLLADDGINRVIRVGHAESNHSDWGKAGVLSEIAVQAPTSVAVSHDDIIAIGTMKEKAVKLYSLDGVFLHDLVPPEKEAFGSITALVFSPNGTLLALDGKEGKLHRFASNRKWEGSASGLNDAQGLAMDPFGYAYVTLAKGQWKEVAPDGSVTGSFGTKGKEPGKLNGATGCVVQGHDQLWVAEVKNNRLQLFKVENADKTTALVGEPSARLQVRREGRINIGVREVLMNLDEEMLIQSMKKQKMEWLNKDGSAKMNLTGKGIRSLAGFARDNRGAIWVADKSDHKLKRLSATGDVELTVGQKGRKEGSIKAPTRLAIRQDGSVVVVDKDDARVQVLSPDGLFLFSVGKEGSKKGEFERVDGLAVTKERIAILDNKRKALLFFDDKGKFLNEVANQDGKAPVWVNAVSLAADQAGRFYVLDQAANRVRIFSNEGKFTADFGATGDRVACGPNNKVLIASQKSIDPFRVYMVPVSVQDLTAKDEAGAVRLDWKPDLDSAKYKVFRSNGGPEFTFVKEVTTPDFTDLETTPGTVYRYAVTGVNALGYAGNPSLTAPIKASRRRDISLVSISKMDFKPVFTAASKFYVTEPFGMVELQNNDDLPYRNVKISLSLKDYTDFPTEQIIDVLGAGEKKEIPVTLTFNDNVLELTEDTPVQMDVRVSYFEENEEKSVSQNAPLTLYSRNTIAWNEKARIASFITPKDPPIVEFSRMGIKAFLSQLKNTTVGKPLAKAVLFYEALNALNIAYVPDPKTPYAEVSSNPSTLDYVQYPRETMRRKTGDCDDTSALLAALLESVGVETALVDTPGHIFMMVNTEENDPELLGFPVERFVEFKGTFWVPIETTKLGKDFTEAWQSASAKVNAGKDKAQIDFVHTGLAADKYAPVTLVEDDPDQPLFPEEKMKTSFPALLKKLEADRYKFRSDALYSLIEKTPNDPALKIKWGMIQIEGGEMAKAEDTFKSLLNDPSVDIQAAAHNNLGNIAFLKGDFAAADKAYSDAQVLAPDDGGIAMNRARIAVKLDNKDKAREYLSEAQKLRTDWREYAGDIPAELLPKQ